jgi:hypothetical protein
VARLGQRLARVLQVVDLDEHLVVADPDTVVREQTLRPTTPDGFFGIVDEDAVRRCIDDVVATRAKIDARVPARQEALAVGQDPVAFVRSADRAAAVTELLQAPLAEAVSVPADDFQAQRHSGESSLNCGHGLSPEPLS